MDVPSPSSNAVTILLLSLDRMCRNLSQLLNNLDADVESCERLLTQVSLAVDEDDDSPPGSIVDENELETGAGDTEDFYEQLCDEQLEPKAARVTDL